MTHIVKDYLELPGVRRINQTKEMLEMKISKEVRLRDFEFWAGAKDRVKLLTDEELDIIEGTLEEIYPDGMDETSVNDLFWFDEDTLAEWIGYKDFEEIIEKR